MMQEDRELFCFVLSQGGPLCSENRVSWPQQTACGLDSRGVVHAWASTFQLARLLPISLYSSNGQELHRKTTQLQVKSSFKAVQTKGSGTVLAWLALHMQLP